MPSYGANSIVGSFIIAVLGAFWAGHSQIANQWLTPISPTPLPPKPWQCEARNYTTEIVSIDPMVIYINDFVTATEADSLVEAGETSFSASTVTVNGRKHPTPDRTSLSAGLPLTDPIVTCILSRARSFLGSTLHPTRDNFGIPQLVRYTAGQKFNLHHDWYNSPQRLADGRVFNRPSSFFVFLQDNCTGGETWFPYVELREESVVAGAGAGVGSTPAGQHHAKWRVHEDGGVAFRPTRGNAVFWVNLFANGTGDRRVMHAGLPVGEGMKTAMNIWPRKYYS